MPEKRFPTLIGLILVLVGLFVSVFLVQLRTRFRSTAGPTFQPQSILISNVKANQLSISFLTQEETEGFISYGTDEALGTLVFDKRDQNTGQRGKYNTHYFTLSGLSANKRYFLKIGSNNTLYGGTFSFSQHCQDFLDSSPSSPPFSLSLTKVDLAPMARSSPISGTVTTLEDDTTPASGAIVCVRIPGALPLSDLTSSSGSFIIPLVSVLKQDFSLLTELPPDAEEETYVFGGLGKQTLAKLKSASDHPIPLLQLGKTYDFRQQLSLPTLLTPTLPPPPPASFELSSPSGEIFDTLPTFRGKGAPGQVLDLVVESPEPLTGRVKIDENGFWAWTPPANLSPGQHTVTITTVNNSGVVQKVVKTFVVMATNPILPVSAGSPSAQLSPSPTKTPTRTPTAISTPTPTKRPTSTPTVRPSPTSSPLVPTTPSPTPTVTPTILPTVTPTPFLTATPTPAELLPAASEFPFYLFLTLGILSTTLGIFMTFKKTT